jgi:hypothetical protein
VFKIWELVSRSQLVIDDLQVQCQYLGMQDKNGEFLRTRNKKQELL